MLLVVLAVVPAMGQSTRPAVINEDQAAENRPLRLGDSDSRVLTNRSAGSSAALSGTADLSRIAIALIAVIGLIILLRALYRHLTNYPGGGKGARLVTVLSRSIVSPKQQVLVLEVGRRLLVVGDSGGQMSALCEITDPDEIAAIIGQARSASPSRSAGSFGAVFRRANEPFEEPEALQTSGRESGDPVNPDDAVTAAEVGGLLDKVRMLQQQFSDSKPALESQRPV
jgi:flagellar protein FliO/FliZ